MTYSHTISGSSSYTDSEIKAVLGKVYDDFHAIDARGFDCFQGDFLKKVRNDLHFLLEKNALIEFQIKINYDDNTVAIHYTVNSFGSIISIDKPSGGIDYYQFPKTANVQIIVSWNNYPDVSIYMRGRGWTSEGKFFIGSSENKGDYAKGNLSINKEIRR